MPSPEPKPPRANRPRILVVEDDPNTAHLLGLYLRQSGYTVDVASDGSAGLREALRLQPELVVLDLMLPGLDGWTLCRSLREIGDVPILILSARQEEEDRVLGLELGADDYVVKPFSPREVVMRVRAILRRTSSSRPARRLGSVQIALDLDRQTLACRGQEHRLTRSEFLLLKALLSAPRRTLSRDELIRVLYPSGGAVVPKAIDVHIGKLRHKTEVDPKQPRHLLTIRGFGYRFEAEA